MAKDGGSVTRVRERRGSGRAANPDRRLLPILLLLALTAGPIACDARFPLGYLRQAAAGGTESPPADLLPASDVRDLTRDVPPPVNVGWDAIVARDTLVALLTFNSTSYFIYRGEPMGYEYELLGRFAEHHDLALRTVVIRDRRDLFRALNRGEGDVVAARLPAMPEYREFVAFTQPFHSTRAVLVQREPGSEPMPAEGAVEGGPDTTEGWVPDPLQEPVAFRARLLRRPSELAGEQVHMPAGSDYYRRIVELSDSMAEDIELVEVEEAEEVEPLIEAVARGQIRLTVSSENLAELSKGRFTNITATPIVGPMRPMSWAVRQNAPRLRAELDRWLASDSIQALENTLYRKYFIDRQGYRTRTEDQLFTTGSGSISRYDSLLTRYSGGIGWDWRLLAAQVAQESRFDPTARSWAGARGLLQLMPRTAREMGVTNVEDPEQSVAGGVRYLQWLSGLWEEEIENPEERQKFILASYNAGRGHVLDAQRLAEKHGDDPTRWEDVAYWLLQKSRPDVYRQDVVRHGYVRGLEPVQYVSRILERYERYRGLDAEG